MIRVNSTSKERVIQIKKEIINETDHNNPKISRKSGGKFVSAIEIGSKRLRESSILKNLVAEKEGGFD